ncbi:hypothetical protein H9P43_001947 [Blastocladiella emersonii ATCC 22665]|nr:hypothetical protein H9P43_001947 [Blastocladiella emersonii ATCC 22665]
MNASRPSPRAPAFFALLLTATAAVATLAVVHGAPLRTEADPAAAVARMQHATNVDNSFSLNFACTAPGTNTGFCGRAEAALTRAARRIASEFKFRRTIRVSARMFLPCNTTTPAADCPQKGVLGSAWVAQRVPVRHRDDGVTYMYPTAVLKQLDFPEADKGQVVWPDADVYAEFNTLRNWWFTDDPDPIKSDQRDLERTMTHELLHGLGFGDDSAMSFPVPAPAQSGGSTAAQAPLMLMPYWESTPPSVQPPPADAAGTQTWNNPNVWYRMARPTLWTRFMLVSGTPAPWIVGNLTAIAEAAVKDRRVTPTSGSGADAVYSPQSMVAAIAGHRTGGALLTALGDAGTKAGSVIYDPTLWPPGAPSNLPKLTIESGLRPFLPGSSIGHVTQAANTTADFLMVYQVTSQSLPGSIAATRAPASGIGPATKAAMVALGYTPRESNDWVSRASVAAIVPEALRAPGTEKDTGRNDGSAPPPSGTSSSSAVKRAGGAAAATLAVAVALAVLG